MARLLALLVWRALTDSGVADNDRRLVLLGLSSGNCLTQSLTIVAVYLLDVPVVRLKALDWIIAEPVLDLAANRDTVGVI